MCPQSLSMCAATPDPRDLMFWIYQGPVGVDTPVAGQWRLVGQTCLRAGDIADQARLAVSIEDFRRLPLPSSRIRVQPATLRTLVNVETNVYVNSGPVVLGTTLFGVPVRVRATPVRYTWTFGDGASLRTVDPGAPYPRMTCTHVYRQPGERAINLVTSYVGEYSVSGGPWLPIEGEAEVSSSAVILTVIEARAHLVDEPIR
jgi:hypothetical protein